MIIATTGISPGVDNKAIGGIFNMIGYIDSGSGNVAVQLIAGGIVGGLFFIKMYWQKLKIIVSGSVLP